MTNINKKTRLMYRLLQVSGTTPNRIAGYIAVHIDPVNKSYRLHKKFLAHKFMCSIRTVNNALKIFKKSKYYRVTNHYVFIEYHSPKVNRAIRILQGGDNNAND